MVGIGSGAGLDRMLFGSQGMQVNRMLDALGLPDSMGDMIGAQMDAAKGDWAGYARNMMDLTGGMGSKSMDQLFGQGLPAGHFAPRPHAMLGKGRKLWGSKFSTPFGTHEISRERLGPKGPFGRRIGRSMERAILTNPAFKARMERVLGGRIIPDGRADGKITVERFRPHFPGLPFSNQIAANPMLSGMYSGLARMQRNLEGVMNQFINPGANIAGGAAHDPMGANKSGGASGTSGTSGSGALKDNDMGKMASEMGMSPPMSFEDVLFLLMLKYAKNKEKQILDKAKELLAKSEKKGGAEGGGRSGRGGGLLGGIGKIAGGVLGGMVGGPVGSAIGGQLGGAVGGALGGGKGGAAGGGGAGGAGGAGGYNPMDSKQSDATDQAVLQKMMNDLQKVYQLLTNVMKSMHDMQMASVRNIR